MTIKDEIVDLDLPNWEKFRKLIEKSPYEILQVAHTIIRTRLGFADMHLSILTQAQDNRLKRAMSEDVIVNLVSSLESTARLELILRFRN
jgi:hypothetical protein